MRQFNLSIPTKIYFGKDILNIALMKEKKLFAGKVMIVIGKQSMRRLGFLNKLLALLKKIDTVNEIFVYEGISSNPKAIEVNTGAKYGIENKVDIVIGLGGGSVIDATKAIAIGIGTRDDIEQYMFCGKNPPKETLPIIAIPTTAGTGSELSKGAIITSIKKNVKTGVRSDNIYPRVAIVDPMFTIQLSEKITKETGFDVLAHAIESYISKQANTFTELLSVEAIKIVVKNLPMIIENGDNIEAREQMSYASMMMGINLGNSSTCLPHRLQYPVGAITDTGHSIGLASLYKAWFRFGYNYSKEKFNYIGELLSDKSCNSKETALKSLDGFMNKIMLNGNLSELGINESNFELICNSVTGNIANDPASGHEGIVRKIYEASL